MRKVDVLLFNDLAGGHARVEHDGLEIAFHRLSRPDDLPPLAGELWAFVDWLLPDTSGLEVCRRLRGNPLTAAAHVTMIVDERDEDARRRALRAGADDYLIGPADRAALLDRIASRGRETCASGFGRNLALGALTIELAAIRARWGARPIPLMPNEFRLLRFLVEHPGRVFTRSQLIAALGKQELPVDERTVDVWIGRLRRALKAAGAGEPVRTVRSLGYVLDLP